MVKIAALSANLENKRIRFAFFSKNEQSGV